ncbi:hypothetical protein KDJ56_09130 [Brevibacillus composti]|uniref:Uncharacterized protein n=1 Tax=Brevibacillus composti TaxID=2796470 RepID=A0A7T5ENY4_9BACL|nr:hypothetical protein [Brevibacillus composti]QQE76058.1 hypothetical protein JD108_09435 [Brevibacillus composti]QUO43086.1 hypothetical protein KDJ56_09130 [Brevibacillus composti]
MSEGLLDAYLDRDVFVYFSPAMVSAGYPSYEEGLLYDYSEEGILLQKPDKTIAYIPTASIRMVTIQPKQGFWSRLTRSS